MSNKAGRESRSDKDYKLTINVYNQDLPILPLTLLIPNFYIPQESVPKSFCPSFETNHYENTLIDQKEEVQKIREECDRARQEVEAILTSIFHKCTKLELNQSKKEPQKHFLAKTTMIDQFIIQVIIISSHL